MQILICGDGSLAEALHDRFRARHDASIERGAITDEIAERAGRSDAVFVLLPAIGSAPDHVLIERTIAGIYRLVSQAKPGARVILLSSLRIFESCPVDWRVTEDWRPRPTGRAGDILVTLAEAVVREAARTRPIRGIVLRYGDIERDGAAPNPWGVHIDDLLEAADLSLSFEPPSGYMWGWPQPDHGWWVFHIVGGGGTQRFVLGHETSRVLGYRPKRDIASDKPPADRSLPASPVAFRSGSPRRVAIFGAWGPMGAALAERLSTDFELRLCDLRTLDEALARPPAVRGDPRPRHLGGKHEERIVDITDPAQVAAAAEGMDALINLSVNRAKSAAAFGVNTIGAYLIAQAALRHGIRRVILTGPEEVSDRQQGGFWPDFQLPAYSSPRPGLRPYFLSKFLGLEACRLLAESHGLEVAALVFGHLRDPEDVDPDTIEGMPIAVSWRDGAEAIAAALVAPELRAFQVFNIVADLPHEKLSNAEAKAVLGWRPRDNLDVLWSRAARERLLARDKPNQEQAAPPQGNQHA